MNIKTLLLNSLTICAFSLVGYVVGQFIGSSLVGEYNPPWIHYVIQSSPSTMVDIVHVDIQSSAEDPTGDILYAATKTGEVYSNTLFQSNWRSVEVIPASNNNWDINWDITECAPKWSTPTDAHMWDSPPVEKKVIDSAGIRIERPASIIARCYVLSDDGSLEVWVHSGNAMDSAVGDFSKMVYALLGVLLGIVIGIVIIRLRKRAKSPAQ